MEERYELISRCVIRRLGKNEIVKSFDCGDADLNDFILHESPHYRKALLAVSYMLETQDDKKIIAYFSLANDRVSLTDFQNKTAFNRFRRKRFVNEKRLKSYPAVKICRLGTDLSARGFGIGTSLLNMIKSYFLDDNKTGCRFVTIDAYASAIPFYISNGFSPLTEEDEKADTRLLYFDLDEVEE